MRDTILDGELVLDTPPGSNLVRSSCTLILSPSLTKTPWSQSVLRFLVFDALVIDDENIMQKTLASRYGVSSSLFCPLRELTNASLAAAPRLLLQTVQCNASGLQRDGNEGTVPVGPPSNLGARLQQRPVVADSNSSKCNSPMA